MAEQKFPTENVVLENVHIARPNFSGLEGKYNVKGKRNFLVVLPDDVAEAMMEDGWNIKRFNPREEGDEPEAFIQVQVKFGGRPPRVVMIAHNAKTTLDEAMINILDWIEVKNADMIIRPYKWGPIQGKDGVTPYLQSLYVTVKPDELEDKYMDLPDSAASSLPSAYDEED